MNNNKDDIFLGLVALSGVLIVIVIFITSFVREKINLVLNARVEAQIETNNNTVKNLAKFTRECNTAEVELSGGYEDEIKNYKANVVRFQDQDGLFVELDCNSMKVGHRSYEGIWYEGKSDVYNFAPEQHPMLCKSDLSGLHTNCIMK